MRKMLKLGLPKLAQYPARALVRLQPDNGKAWGVLGYMHGREDRHAEAIEATVRAAEHAGDDPSVRHNLGQLVALYDLAPVPPRLPNAVKRKLARLRGRLGEKPEYAKAYQSVEAIYERHAERQEQLREELAGAERSYLLTQQDLLALDQQLREINAEIAEREARIDRLDADLHHAGVFPILPRGVYTGGGVRVYTGVRLHDGVLIDTGTVYAPGLTRRRIRARIREQEALIDQLEDEADGIRERARPLLSTLREKRRRLRRVQEKMQPVGRELTARLSWDPPAVDGVVTDEAAFVPRGEKPDLPRDPETRAAQQLKLARLYLGSDMPAKARQIARRIVRKYPKTGAAKEARNLLEELPAEREGM